MEYPLDISAQDRAGHSVEVNQKSGCEAMTPGAEREPEPYHQEKNVAGQKCKFRIDVKKRYPDAFKEVIENECNGCDSGHKLGSCIHMRECTEDYLKTTGWLMPLRQPARKGEE